MVLVSGPGRCASLVSASFDVVVLALLNIVGRGYVLGLTTFPSCHPVVVFFLFLGTIVFCGPRGSSWTASFWWLSHLGSSPQVRQL